MGIIDFFKEAVGAQPSEDDLREQVKKLGLNVQNFGASVDNGVATVTGLAVNRAEASKIVMAIGNNKGVTKVVNKMRVPLSSIQPPAASAPQPPAGGAAGGQAGDADADEEKVRFHKVESGDTLSKIAQKVYGDAGKYPVIFEANRPMLKDPDEIYPGQVLRIPGLG